MWLFTAFFDVVETFC